MNRGARPSRSRACCAIPKRPRSSTSFAGAVARHAKGADVPARSPTSSRSSTRTFAARFQRETTMFVESQIARRSQHRRSDHRRLFVRQRAARAALRIARRLRRALPSRDVHRPRPRRHPRPGHRADGDVVPRSHGAGGARLLGARKPARHAATAAAAGHSRSEDRHRRRPAVVDAGADGEASRRIRRARSVTCAWIRWAFRWRTSMRSAAGANRAAACPSTHRRRFADGTPIDGVRRAARLHRQAPGQLRADVRRRRLLTYALGRQLDYRDQPAIRQIVREAGASGHRWSAIIRGIVTSTPFQMGRTSLMMITKKALSRRTVLRATRRRGVRCRYSMRWCRR